MVPVGALQAAPKTVSHTHTYLLHIYIQHNYLSESSKSFIALVAQNCTHTYTHLLCFVLLCYVLEVTILLN